jgi:hypothetical protein
MRSSSDRRGYGVDSEAGGDKEIRSTAQFGIHGEAAFHDLRIGVRDEMCL